MFCARDLGAVVHAGFFGIAVEIHTFVVNRLHRHCFRLSCLALLVCICYEDTPREFDS